MCESEDRARCWKKQRQRKDNRAQAVLFKQTLDGMGLRIAVVSQTWLA